LAISDRHPYLAILVVALVTLAMMAGFLALTSTAL
jgi:hypothetical protein